MAAGQDTKELEASLAALNKSAERMQTLWFTFMGVTLYFMLTALTTTHRMLLLEEPQTLPVINLKIPLLPFYVIAPMFYWVIHFYVLLMLVLLARSARVFEDVLRRDIPIESDREMFRTRVENTLFLQMLVGARPERSGATGRLLATMAVITVAIAPIVTLLVMQMQFLPYHHFWITWEHRAVVVLDLALLPTLWRGYRVRWGQPWPRGWMTVWRERRGWRKLAIPASFSARALGVLMTLWVTMVEGRWAGEPYVDPTVGGDFVFLERLDLTKQARLLIPAREVRAAMSYPVDGLVQNEDRDAYLKTRGFRFLYSNHLLSDRLMLAGESIVGQDLVEQMSKNALTKSGSESLGTRGFQGRDFTSADFSSSDLRGVNLQAAHLREANFDGAYMEAANLEYSIATHASFNKTRLPHAKLAGARMDGANLFSTNLRGAYLTNTDLSGATLWFADLIGANLWQARLTGAVIESSNLLASNLSDAYMEGVRLKDVNLEGASLFGAHLQLATFSQVDLRGATLSHAQLQFADLKGADFGYADLSRSFVYGSQLPLHMVAPGAPILTGMRFDRSYSDEGSLSIAASMFPGVFAAAAIGHPNRPVTGNMDLNVYSAWRDKILQTLYAEQWPRDEILHRGPEDFVLPLDKTNMARVETWRSFGAKGSTNQDGLLKILLYTFCSNEMDSAGQASAFFRGRAAFLERRTLHRLKQQIDKRRKSPSTCPVIDKLSLQDWHELNAIRPLN